MAIQPIRFNPYQRQTLPTLPQANTVGPSHIYSEATRQLGDIGDIFNSRILKDKEEAGAKERAEIDAKALVDAAKARASATRHPDWANQKAQDRPLTPGEIAAHDEEVRKFFRPGATVRDEQRILKNLNRISQTGLTDAQTGEAKSNTGYLNAKTDQVVIANNLEIALADVKERNALAKYNVDYLDLANKSKQIRLVRDVINDPEYAALFKSNQFAGLRTKDLENQLLNIEVDSSRILLEIAEDQQPSATEAGIKANQLSAYTDDRVLNAFKQIEVRAQKASEQIDRRVSDRGFARVGGLGDKFNLGLTPGYETDYAAGQAGADESFHEIFDNDPDPHQSLATLNGYIAEAIDGLEKITGPNGEQYFVRDYPMTSIRDNLIKNPELITDPANHAKLEQIVHSLFNNANGRTLDEKARTKAEFDAQIQGLTYDGFYDDIGKLLSNIKRGWSGGVPVDGAQDLSTPTGLGPLQTLPLYKEYGR